MKIENSGVTITEVPGLDSIKIFPGGAILVDFGGYSDEFTVETLASLREAIGEALKQARQMIGQSTPGQTEEPRHFEADSSEPGPEITKVCDQQGDIWHRVNGTQWTAVSGCSWFSVLDFAPLTEVRD